MKKLKKHSARLSTNNKRFPWELVFKDEDKNAVCKFCGRTPLVGGFDLSRTIDGKDEYMCLECKKEGRHGVGIADLGMVLVGLRGDEDFPLAPEKGTSHREKVGRNCATCGKPIYWNPYKKRLIGAYNEFLRGITVHEKCGMPKHI